MVRRQCLRLSSLLLGLVIKCRPPISHRKKLYFRSQFAHVGCFKYGGHTNLNSHLWWFSVSSDRKNKKPFSFHICSLYIPRLPQRRQEAVHSLVGSNLSSTFKHDLVKENFTFILSDTFFSISQSLFVSNIG